MRLEDEMSDDDESGKQIKSFLRDVITMSLLEDGGLGINGRIGHWINSIRSRSNLGRGTHGVPNLVASTVPKRLK